MVAKVLGPSAGPKIDIFKYKAKTGYRRRQGHRQKYSRIEITKIQGPKKATVKKDESTAEAAETATKKPAAKKSAAATTTKKPPAKKAATQGAGGRSQEASSEQDNAEEDRQGELDVQDESRRLHPQRSGF